MLSNAWRFRKLLRDWRPDVLVTCNWGAIEFALANILPVTRHLHVMDGFGPEERATQIPRRVLTRRIALSRTPVVLPSHNLVRIATEVWKLPPRVIRYVPNGVDLDRFATGGGQRGSAEPVIGTVAALRAEKNIARLLRAFAMLPPGLPVGPAGHRRRRAGACGAGGAGRLAGRGGAGALRRPSPGYGGVLCPVRHLRAVVGHRTDAAFGDRGDGQRPAGGLDRCRRCAADGGGGECAACHAAGRCGAGGCAGGADRRPGARRRIGLANRAKAEREFDQAAMFAAYGALWRGTPTRLAGAGPTSRGPGRAVARSQDAPSRGASASP